MSILKKTVLMVVCITVALFTLVYIISNFIYIKGFAMLEQQQVERNIIRVSDSLQDKLDNLYAFCVDWAASDDTYYFAKQYNKEYVDKNLTDDSFTTSDTDLFMVLDTQGNLVYEKYFSLSQMKEIPVPADWLGLISNNIITKTSDTQPCISSVIILSGQPVMFSCCPILTSTKDGPSTGYLVMGRVVDEAMIKSLTVVAQFPVSVLPIQAAGQAAEVAEALNSLGKTEDSFIKKESGNILAGYAIFNDVNGNPAFVYKVSVPRDIFSQGQKAIAYLHSSLFILAVAFCVAFIFLFKYLILSRLTTLSNAVNAIGSTGEITNRVKIKGNDELSRLSDNINGMLESLEKSEIRRESQKEVISHIVTLTPNGVVAVNDTGYITLLNDAFRDAFDLKNHSLLGVKLEDLPDMSDIAVEINNFRLSRMTSFKKEIQRVRNGTKRIFIASFARLKEEEIYILYLTDISEERSKQESLYLTDRLASIGEMASGIAHELNNPLTSIIGLSEIVMRDEVPDSVKEDMGMIKSESHRAAGIVRNLLSFARKNSTLKQPDNINKIISDVLRLRSYEQGVNNIKIIKELDNNLPDILIDHSQIQQVFINIILNAEYAMVTAHGKGILRVKTELADNMIKTSFIDDGPGIEPGNLRHIFDPFFTTKEVGKGTGLGLSISYGIVTTHNGHIYATSEFGKGATFVVELPLNNPAAKEAK
jgi:signal transduction histidine kinase